MTLFNATDVLIIGGGINGVSTAFHLAKLGASVILLEKNFIAAGPTGRSGAIIRQHYSNLVTARMALKSMRVWQNFDAVVGGDAGFTNTGFLIGVRPQDIEGLKANIDLQQSVGINTRFVSPDEIREIEPYLDPTGLGGGAYEPEGGYCDPAMAANAFAQAAQRYGVEIRTGIKATGIKIQGNRVTGVETDWGDFDVKAVVIAAGPWSSHLLKTIGIDLPIITARVKVGLFRRPQNIEHHLILGDFVNQIYLRPETGNLIMVGSISADETKDRVSNPDSFNDKVEIDILADFAERAALRYPAMKHGYVTGGFASLYDITPDWHPIIDAIPDIEGLYICAGGSGHGFKLAPAVGEMMANLVINGKQPGDDINLFSFERFSAGNLVRGQYEYSIIG